MYTGLKPELEDERVAYVADELLVRLPPTEVSTEDDDCVTEEADEDETAELPVP